MDDPSMSKPETPNKAKPNTPGRFVLGDEVFRRTRSECDIAADGLLHLEV
jgi:hypothetical protein